MAEQLIDRPPVAQDRVRLSADWRVADAMGDVQP